MSLPHFSIVIPTYNRSNQLSKVIQQILTKQRGDFEIIIVDDGSTDNTKVVVENWIQTDSRIKYLFKTNGGVSSARNFGVTKANGEYVIFFDDDDEFSDTWISDFEEKRESEHADIILCGMKRIDHLHNTVQDVYPEYPYKDEGKWGIFLPGAFAVKKELFIKAGTYDEYVLYGENSELGLRIRAASTSHSFVHSLNYIYLPSFDGGSKNLKKKVDSNVYVLEKHKDYFKKYPRTKKHYAHTTAFAAAHLGNFKLARKLLKEAMKVDKFNARMILQYLLLSNKITAKLRWKQVGIQA